MPRCCFLDRFPLFTRPGAEELAFCYIDSTVETSGPLRYPLAPLPAAIRRVAVTASTRFGQAQTRFERVLSRGRLWLTKLADPDRLLAPFRDRKLFEKREISGFDRFRLDALRDDMYCSPGRHFARMFERWETSGEEAIRAGIGVQKMPAGRFSTCFLPHDYDLLEAPKRRHERLDEP